MVETVVNSSAYRPIEEEPTLEGGSDGDVLTGGDGADLQFGELGRDVLLGGFAFNVPDRGITETAKPIANITTDLADAVLGELFIDCLELPGTLTISNGPE